MLHESTQTGLVFSFMRGEQRGGRVNLGGTGSEWDGVRGMKSPRNQYCARKRNSSGNGRTGRIAVIVSSRHYKTKFAFATRQVPHIYRKDTRASQESRRRDNDFHGFYILIS